MHTTSASLLVRVRQPSDQEAWQRFVKLYTPLLYFWARRLGLQEQDAGDLVQDVLTNLVRKMPEFRYDGEQSFRNWLKTMFLNLWRNQCRRQPLPVQPGSQFEKEDSACPDPAEAFAEADYRKQLVGRALELMQSEFQPNTWKACWEHVVSGRSAAEVAADLGISEGAVYVAKFRVLKRLNQELQGLLD
jgi:RNA polymerase sigma-70 factor (ECF subfamily)